MFLHRGDWRISAENLRSLLEYDPPDSWKESFWIHTDKPSKDWNGIAIGPDNHTNSRMVWRRPDLWSKMLRDAEDIASRISEAIEPPESLRRRRRWRDDEGDEFHPSRLLEGDSPWLEDSKFVTRGPRDIVLVPCAAFHSGIKHSVISAAAASVAAFARVLEQAHYRVAIVTAKVNVSAYESGPPNLAMAVHVKSFGDTAPEFEIVASHSPWFYRGAIFAHIGREQTDIPREGLGRPIPGPYLSAGSRVLPGHVKDELRAACGPPGCEIVEFNPSFGGELDAKETLDNAVTIINAFLRSQARD
jgi:hypothetical protein